MDPFIRRVRQRTVETNDACEFRRPQPRSSRVNHALRPVLPNDEALQKFLAACVTELTPGST